ncbi:MAG: hypothetical protein GEV28_37050 [Actinophytocola sp.]|uniref:hypothetical protein n=1 Tax=Actinophytocola sp. TaxID=1872138 RepID=UPI00132A2D7B|nr:hypothetical protein [Actinophytocola sp.]MPZ85690.1 hypothetical protein [Actinophytocola sp.]
MDGYGVIIEEIRSCGRDAVTAGEDTGRVDLPAAVSGVEPALPGSASAGSASTLSMVWKTRLRTLGDDVVRLGTDLGGTAEEYAHNEATARANLETADRRHRRHE